MTRRELLRAAASAGVLLTGAPAVLRGRFRLFGSHAAEYSARAVRLVEGAVVVDLLNQFRFQDFTEHPVKITAWLDDPATFTAADAVAYQQSGITVFCLGESASDYRAGVEFYATWNRFLTATRAYFTRITSVADIDAAKRNGKVGVMLTFQDSTHFRTPDDVPAFFGMGQRLSQLTYNFNNGIGCGFLETTDTGLSEFGHAVMARMEQVGMAVDVSHCGDRTTLDALAAATKPIVITHATCRAIVPGALRAKTDEMIRKTAKTGGVMGVSFIRFMDRADEPVTIENVLDQFDYVKTLVGLDHVGVGSDLDVVGNPNPIGGGFQPTSQRNFERYKYHADADGKITVKGLDHPKRMFDLAEGLIRRKYSDDDIRAILGGNATRVFRAIWPAAVA